MYKKTMKKQENMTEQTHRPSVFPQETPIPNSAMQSFFGISDQAGDQSAIRDKLIARLNPSIHPQAQIPAAEQEAERLSASVRSGGQAEVKAAMGQQLGGDFSEVHFHTDGESAALADSLGARAFTAGQDIYFGTGGFAPEVAAHELVHTAQQGAVTASGVAVSAPMGGVQRVKDKKAPSSPPQVWNDEYIKNRVGKLKGDTIQRIKDLEKRFEDNEDERDALKDRELKREKDWDAGKDWETGKASTPSSNPAESKPENYYGGSLGLNTYSMDKNYPLMNCLTRRQIPKKGTTDFRIKEMVAANRDLQESMTKGNNTKTLQDMVVYRGGEEDGEFAGIDRTGEPLDPKDKEKPILKREALATKLSKGSQVVSNPSFTSTSMKKNAAIFFAENREIPVLIHALLPKGSKAQYMEGVSEIPIEEEMLLPQETSMRILADEYRKDDKDMKDDKEMKKEMEKDYHSVYGEYLPLAIGAHRSRPKYYDKEGKEAPDKDPINVHRNFSGGKSLIEDDDDDACAVRNVDDEDDGPAEKAY